VIITGAGRGIGRATAVELHRRGYQLVLVARTLDDLQETNGLAGGDALVEAIDATDPLAAERVAKRAHEQFGRIDALVHCAGVAPVLDVTQTTPQRWREVLEINLSAAFYFARAVWPIMKQQGGGVIVNLSSFAARDPFGGFAAYGAAKAGVNLLGLSLAREGAAIGIRVHTVAPAAVETEMFRRIVPAEQYPTEKTLSPAEVAQVITHCVTGDLRYTSGEVIWLQKSAL
jgi:NAD(P)-dependent dehydrogenase (short-subunit alcohol dehydrogenase family)